MEIYSKDGTLYHHGIKGQKWGKRRFQNQDGSLTPAGKKRYGSQEEAERDAVNTLKKAAKNEALAEHVRARGRKTAEENENKADEYNRMADEYDKKGKFIDANDARRKAADYSKKAREAYGQSEAEANRYMSAASKLRKKVSEIANDNDVTIGEEYARSIVSDAKYRSEKRIKEIKENESKAEEYSRQAEELNKRGKIFDAREAERKAAEYSKKAKEAKKFVDEDDDDDRDFNSFVKDNDDLIAKTKSYFDKMLDFDSDFDDDDW